MTGTERLAIGRRLRHEHGWNVAERHGVAITETGIRCVDGFITGPSWYLRLLDQVFSDGPDIVREEGSDAGIRILDEALARAPDAVEARYILGQDGALEDLVIAVVRRLYPGVW